MADQFNKKHGKKSEKTASSKTMTNAPRKGAKVVAKKDVSHVGLRAQHRKNGLLVAKFILERKEQGRTPSSLVKDIPYLLPSFGKTTQYVEVRLYLTVQNITTATSTAYTSVLNIQASVFNNFTDFAGIFDEYRVIEGEIAYFPTTNINPTTWTSGSGACVAAIDYGISTALGSTTAAVSHDNKRFFHLVNTTATKNNPSYGQVKWPVKLEKLPDQDWLLASNSAQNFAYWKPYMAASDSPGAGVTGFLWGWMDFQFRGMSA